MEDVAPDAHNQAADARNQTVDQGVDVSLMAVIASRMWNPKNRLMLHWSPVSVSWSFIRTATVSCVARPIITRVNGPIPLSPGR